METVGRAECARGDDLKKKTVGRRGDGGLGRIRRSARTRLGLARLRPPQEAGVQSVLAGRDTLVIMPTGSGKSAIYQLAGLLIAGPTVGTRSRRA